MTSTQVLELIKLLSALESWSFCSDNKLPDYLSDKLNKIMKELSNEALGLKR